MDFFVTTLGFSINSEDMIHTLRVSEVFKMEVVKSQLAKGGTILMESARQIKVLLSIVRLTRCSCATFGFKKSLSLCLSTLLWMQLSPTVGL